MPDRQFDDLPRREHPLELPLKVLPLGLAPEVVHHQEAAGEQVSSKCLYLVFAEDHFSRLDDVNKWILKQRGLGEVEHRAFRIDL